MNTMSARATVVVALLIAIAAASPAPAQDYYFRGKTITIFAGRPPGGGVDSEMRLVAQHLPLHIPGRPGIVPKNMPGAGGVALGNHMFGVAAPDGLTLAVPGRTAFVLAPVVGNPNARYDLRKLTWIGSAASSNFMMWLRRGTGISTLAELRNAKKEIVIGGSSGGNSDTVVPELLAKYEKFPFKVVRGYPGTAEQALALARGEIDGMFTERASFRADPVASGLAVPVFQTFPIESGLATLEEIATNLLEKALFRLFNIPLRVGLAVIAPPDLPADVTRVLRESYLTAITSREYQEQAAKRGFEVGKPNSGQEIADYIASNLSTVSPEVIHEFRTYMQ
jgi:tripartite-type tricarboxylate transporter receptor subunit TctC